MRFFSFEHRRKNNFAKKKIELYNYIGGEKNRMNVRFFARQTELKRV